MVRQDGSPRESPESRLKKLALVLPDGPSPLGTYVEVVRTGNLVFLSGILPVVNHKPKYQGRLGRDLDSQAGRDAARTAALVALAAAREHLGTLGRIARPVRLGVFIAANENFSDQPGVADGASDLYRDIFGIERLPVRSVIGVASLPLGVPVLLDIIFEVTD